MQCNRDDAKKILQSWHQIEFFQPYNLQKTIDDKIHCELNSSDLRNQQDSLLPWCNKKSFFDSGADPSKRYGFNLYLIAFDQCELAQEVKREELQAELPEIDSLEEEERIQLQGLTCFAKLWIDELGCPDFEGFSVSTLPWAMGMLIHNRLDNLSFDKFNQRCDRLKEALEKVENELSEGKQGKVLNAKRILNIIKILFSWADYIPKKNVSPSCYIEFVELKSERNDSLSDSKDDEALDEGECTATSVLSMPILNSFYIEDIERSIQFVSTQHKHSPLDDYLSQEDEEKRVDLYDLDSQQSLNEIERQLAPGLMNSGRWPSSPEHNMSLMQQYALNHMFEKLKIGGLYSVNGPPGTGKTTLLRDAMAENIVRRAKELAKLRRSNDAFQGKHTVSFGDEKCTFSELKENITGFEMVVASSNNAAVENISKELPLLKELGKDFTGMRYLRPTGNQVHANKKGGRLQSMERKSQCWGLFSAALGKQSNRSKFVDRAFIYNHFKDNIKARDERTEEIDFLNLWQVRSEPKKRSFSDAKEEFKSAENKYNKCFTQLNTFADLHKYLQQNDEDSLCAPVHQRIVELESLIEKINESLAICREGVDETKERKSSAKILWEQKERNCPRFWHRWFNTKTYLIHIVELEQAENVWVGLNEKLIDLNQNIRAQQREIEKSKGQKVSDEAELEKIILSYHQDIDRYRKFKSIFPKIKLPNIAIPISDDELQRSAYWQNGEINNLRSVLFQRAIELHEAWLLEVIEKDGGFGGNLIAISNLLQGKKLTDNKMGRLIWQGLFLTVPVISTTFASFARQFELLKEGDLGWLFIDEAGQAIPQAAVGALMRAKRAVVVGDPLQIEPVFTAPTKLVERLMKFKLGDRALDWSPNIVSVQQLADRVNLYGSYIESNGGSTWLGSPLLVHRRCINPMFDIANAIAYDNRMVHGLEKSEIQPEPNNLLGDSAWIHVTGNCSIKQFVPSHADVLVNILKYLYLHEGELPIVYVISPFKAVKEKVLSELSKPEKLLISGNQSVPDKDSFKKWRKDCFGTVHTFQGKECVKVIFVLGCDENNSGGAAWASSKPNLLNVAATRAKQQFYIIGNKEVWAKKAYFAKASSSLRNVSSDEFLGETRRIQNAAQASTGFEIIESMRSD